MTSRPNWFRHLGGVLSLLALGGACGGGDDSGPPGGAGGRATTSAFLGSCDTRAVAGPSSGQCREWVGDGTADLSVSCDGLAGAFSTTARCPTDGRVGTCTLRPLLGMSAVYGYYSPDYTVQQAQEHCARLDGTFG